MTVSVSVIWLVRKIRHPSTQSAIIIDPLSVMGIFFVLWVMVQLVPVPASILAMISPQTNTLWNLSAVSIDTSGLRTISLYPFVTRKAIVAVSTILLFYWMCLYTLKSSKSIRYVIIGLLVIGFGESCYGFWQALSSDHYVLWVLRPDISHIAAGTFIDRNHLAVFLAMTVCIGCGYVWALYMQNRGHYQKRAKRNDGIRFFETRHLRIVVVVLTLCVLIAAVLVTASRGGVLSLFAAFVVMGGLLIARFFKNKQIYIIIVLSTIALSYIGYVSADRVMQRFEKVEQGFENRLEVARSTIEMGRDFPLTGIGLSAFQFVYPRYQRQSLTVLRDYALNDWVQLFAETGIVGFGIVLIAFVWSLGMVIVRWRKRRDPFIVGISLGGIGALVVVSIYALSEFSLHMPANALVLAVILAITYKALYLHGDEDAEYFTYPSKKILLPRVVAGVLVLAVTAGALFMGKDAIALWRADAMARTFWNSTIPFKEPTNGELKEAWSLVPGNATYWSWVARRVYADKDGNLELIKDTPYERADDPIFELWQEALKRNPGYWHIWHAMGWAAFQRHAQNPEKYYPIALTALDRSVELHPYDAQGYFVKGIAGLTAAHDGYITDDYYWLDAFREAIGRDPSYIKGVTNQILLYDDCAAVDTLLTVLPARAAPYLAAARYCFMKGAVDIGLDLLKRGEEIKSAEISRLWNDYVQNGSVRTKEGVALLRDILALDLKHPRALLEKGKVIEALKMQDQRDGQLADFADLKHLRWTLKDMQRRDESKALPYYYQGRVEEELGNEDGAILMYRRSLSLNPQYFPTWIHLRDLMKTRVRTAGDTIEMESIERKINLFGMDSIPASSWKLRSRKKDITTWSAPFRCGYSLAALAIGFETEKGEGAWKLMADGRFVTAWKGSKRGNEGIDIPAGEHEMELVYFGTITELEKRQRPFDIHVGLER